MTVSKCSLFRIKKKKVIRGGDLIRFNVAKNDVSCTLKSSTAQCFTLLDMFIFMPFLQCTSSVSCNQNRAVLCLKGDYVFHTIRVIYKAEFLLCGSAQMSDSFMSELNHGNNNLPDVLVGVHFPEGSVYLAMISTVGLQYIV